MRVHVTPLLLGLLLAALLAFPAALASAQDSDNGDGSDQGDADTAEQHGDSGESGDLDASTDADDETGDTDGDGTGDTDADADGAVDDVTDADGAADSDVDGGADDTGDTDADADGIADSDVDGGADGSGDTDADTDGIADSDVDGGADGSGDTDADTDGELDDNGDTDGAADTGADGADGTADADNGDGSGDGTADADSGDGGDGSLGGDADGGGDGDGDDGGTDPADPDALRITPGSLVRGAERVVRLSAPGIGAVTEVTVLTPGVVARSVSSVGGDALDVVFTVSETAPLGEIEAILVGASPNPGDALRVVPGSIALISASPSILSRGDDVTVRVRGRNLDTLTRLETAEPLEILSREVVDPTALDVVVRVPTLSPAGEFPLVAFRGAGQVQLPGAFELEAVPPEFVSITPESIARGAAQLVEIRGVGFQALTGLSAGPRVEVSGLEVVSDTRITARLAPRDDAAAGPAPLTFQTDGQAVNVPDAWSITAGPMALLDVRPGNVYRDEEPTVLVDGRNLEGISDIDLGPGITVTELLDASPARVWLRLDVSEDAPLTVRDLRASGDHGEATLSAAIRVGDIRLPAPEIDFPAEVDLPTTDTGALRFVALTLTNEGELAEAFTIGSPTGDPDIIAFGDPDEPFLNLTELEIELDPGESVTLHVRFAPVIRTTSVVAFEVSMREGEFVEPLVIRGQSGAQTLRFNRPSPLNIGELPLGEQSSIPTLRLVQEGAESAVLIRSIVVELVRNEVPVANPDQTLNWNFVSSTASDPPPWAGGAVEWSFFGERLGIHEVRLLFETTRSSAPMVPFVLRFRVEDNLPGPGDGDGTGDDTPSDDGDDTDDVGDGALDDVGNGDDTDLGGDDVDEGESSGGDGSGCCAVAGPPPSPWLVGLVLLGLVGLRRRSTQPGPVDLPGRSGDC